MNKEEFINKANNIHIPKGRKYDYSKVEFKKMSDTITIICYKHGEFKQKVSVHINDECGCKLCAKELKRTHKKTTEQFIIEAKEIHNNKYNYELVEYKNSHSKVILKCNGCNRIFEILPYAHTAQKQGCYNCGIKSRRIPHVGTTTKFVEKAMIKWDNKYDYSITKYVNKNTKIKYICREHGEQHQYPTLHIKHGCQFCNGRGISKYSRITFENAAKLVYGDKFDYSLVDYKNTHEKIKIICKKHGEFEQMPYIHLNLVYGCPKCAQEIERSKQEEEITKFIKEIYNGKILNNEKILNGKEIDIYLPELKLGIEYHGLYWHTHTMVGRNYHKYKADIADSLGIKLIQIYENEYFNKKDIVFSKIKSYLNLNNKIYARNTKIVEISKNIKDSFLNNYHLQGNDKSKIFLGLEANGTIVACMTFGKSRFNKNIKYELIRYCSIKDYNIIGGASKLLSYFKNSYKGGIISYADRRWSNGNLYNKIGFRLDKLSNPGYLYYNINKKTVHNRLKFQKHKLTQMENYSENKSEYEIMLQNGYDRVWDAGYYRFIMEEN